MKIRHSVHNLLRLLILIAALVIGPASVAWSEPEGDVSLTLDQARDLAAYSLRNGQPELTVRLASGLLQADPKDPLAHYLQAAAYAQLERPRDGRRAAARAYRFARTEPDRFQAAQLASRMAYEDNRPTLAQIWLRRTAIHAPNEEAEKQIARDYRFLRAENPWAFRLRAQLAPSSNVNNGADTSLQIIDGVPVTGNLSGSAQALSGLIGSLDFTTSYRLRASETSATTLTGRLYVERVALSAAAKEKAPEARGSDYDYTFGEVALRHGFAVGPADRNGVASVGLALGKSWYAGSSNFSYVRASADRSWQLTDNTWLELLGVYENRFDSRFASNAAQIWGFGAELSRGLGNGDRLTFTFAYRDADAESVNGTYSSTSLRASYAFGQPLGPVLLSAGLVLGYSDYPVFRSGFFLVPGGRQDKSAYGDISMMFHEFDYAGFAPVLRIRAGRRLSNDSRYNIRELSISLGIESKF